MCFSKIIIFLCALFVCVLSIFVLFVGTVFAGGYEPISPLPGVEYSTSTDGLANYFNRIFIIFISVLAVLGVIKLMICGFQYMTSEAISSKEEAKKCISGVIGGLLLVLLSVLILNTINPELTRLTFFDSLQRSVPDLSGSTRGGTGGGSVQNVFSPRDPFLTAYNNRDTGDQGYCFTGNGGFTGGDEIRCSGSSGGSPWTASECAAAATSSTQGLFNFDGIRETCYSTSGGSRGIGQFCLTARTNEGEDGEQQCSSPDSLQCESYRNFLTGTGALDGNLPDNEVSRCYRPGG